MDNHMIICPYAPEQCGASIESSRIQQRPAPKDLLQIVHGTGDMEKDWDLRARTHARYYIDGGYYQTEEEFDRSGSRSLEIWILRDIELDRQAAVLEIGCGIGRILKPLASMVREVHGVDVSGEMLAQGTERLKDFPNIELHKTSGADLTGLPDHYFDFCFSLVTFRHIPQKKIIYGYFKDASRALKPGGLFWFQVDGSMDGISSVDGTSRQDNAGTWEGVVFTETEIRHYLSEYGFEILDLWGHETLDFCVTARLKQQKSVADTTLVRFSKRSWNENILRAFLTRLCPACVEERLAQLLAGSLSVRRLANSFLETRQNLSIEEYVRDIYQVFLGREPDVDGYHSYVDAIRTGTLRREGLIDAVITSYEFDRMLVRNRRSGMESNPTEQ
jgi:ubiquinone/menaquinone biosynthesis C-methylase UbiE